MKYGRAGKQKQRFVYLSKDEKRLYWKNSSKSMDKPRFIEVDEVIPSRNPLFYSFLDL